MSLIIFAAVLFLAPLLSALPEEPVWSLIFGTLLLLASSIRIVQIKNDESRWVWPTAFFGVGAFALISLLVNWLFVHHAEPVYLDTMLRGTVFWWSVTAAFWFAASNRSRATVYLTLIAISAGASIAAGIGFQDYLLHLRHHEAQWREFGTSTPDFFAGQLVMTFPIAFALFLGAKSGKGKIFWLPYLVAFLLQVAVIPTTGSRFALISMAVGIVVFLAAIYLAVKSGMAFPAAAKQRLLALCVIVVLGGALVAKPVLNRLSASTLKAQASSGDFREWTWKGTLRLIAAEPVLGSGPGTFVYAYPKRAIVGFTRHAHSAYLQLASELGIPALFFLLAAFGCLFTVAFFQLSKSEYLKIDDKRPAEEAMTSRSKRKPIKQQLVKQDDLGELYDQASLVDDRLLVAGILGSLAAAMVQNLIDSDWFTFGSGVTLFALAGAATSLLPRPTVGNLLAVPKVLLATVFVVGAIIGAWLSVAEIQEQSGDYAAAIATNPLSALYQGNIAMKVFLPQRDAGDTEQHLLLASHLAPDSVSYHRLGTFYLDVNRPQDALSAFKSGLVYDPNSIQLLLSLAQTSTALGEDIAALGYYQRIADLETSPYGTVRAIPEVSETRFADADAAVGDSLLAKGLYGQALLYFSRGQDDCEEYSAAGGGAQPMRAAINQGVVDSELDSHMRTLYIGLMNNMAIAYAKEGKISDAQSTKERLISQLKLFPGG